jgi:hypothetical protein
MFPDMIVNYEIGLDPNAPDPARPVRMTGRCGDVAWYATEADAVYAAARQPDAGGGDWLRAADQHIAELDAVRAAERAAVGLPDEPPLVVDESIACPWEPEPEAGA